MRYSHTGTNPCFPSPAVKPAKGIIFVILPGFVRNSYNIRIFNCIIYIFAREPVIHPQTEIKNHTAKVYIVLSIKGTQSRIDFINIIIQTELSNPWFININYLHFLELQIETGFKFIFLIKETCHVSFDRKFFNVWSRQVKGLPTSHSPSPGITPTVSL